jgi:phosphoribosylformylglycinamidine synthase subunit PurQ / glutaminase
MKALIGIVRFLGSNCDRDVERAVLDLGFKSEFIWAQDRFSADRFSHLILPGGFSHGDYLRSGALAARAPAMDSVREAVARGVPTLGICNGFQVLCETGLLPGALVRNESLRFVDRWVGLVAPDSTPDRGPEIQLPVAHGDGRFVADDRTIDGLFQRGEVWWTYAQNPNGSVGNIAGLQRRGSRVFGLMPHPERAMADWMGGSDGRTVLAGFLQ